MNIYQVFENLRKVPIKHIYDNQVFSSVLALLTGISLILSIIQCFFGYKLLKWWTSFFGFVTFAGIGYYAGYALKKDTSSSIIYAIVLGIIGSLITFSLYKIGLLFIGFTAGFLLGYKILENLQLGIALGIGIIILLIIFMKPVLIIFTSISSAIVAGRNLAEVLNLSKNNMIIFTIIIAMAGIIFQFLTNSIDIHKKKSRNRNKFRTNLGISGKIKNFIHRHIQFEEDDDDEYYDESYYDDKTDLNYRYDEDSNYDISDDKTISIPKINKELYDDNAEILKNDYDDEFKFKDIDGHNFNKDNKKTDDLIRCPKCNNLCKRYDKFCNNCGNKLNQ